MAFPSDLVRTKDWGTEILTDQDLEGQFDIIIDWIDDFADESGGHKHDGTSNEGPKIDLTNSVTGELQETDGGTGLSTYTAGDMLYSASADTLAALAKGTARQLMQMNTGATAPEWTSQAKLLSMLLGETTAPSTAASEGALYTKDIGGQPELFYREESDGDEVQMTAGGASLAITQELFTADGTFVAPTGITQVLITMVAAGGGGGGSNGTAAGGGGGGESIILQPFTVIAGNSYTVQVGVGGAGATAGDNDGTVGEDSVFDTGGSPLTADGGLGGNKGSVATGSSGGGGSLDALLRTAGVSGFKGGNGGNGGSGGGGGGGTYWGVGGLGAANSNNSPGQDGTGFGSAGSGGYRAGGGSNQIGGDGQDGFVLVSY